MLTPGGPAALLDDGADDMTAATTTRALAYFEVWRVLPGGRWVRAGRCATRAEALTTVPDRGQAPGWFVLPVSATFATARARASSPPPAEDATNPGARP